MTLYWERRIPDTREPLMNDYEAMRKVTEYYLMEGDLQGLLKVASYSQIIVAKALSEGRFSPKMIYALERDPEAAVRLYRQVRWKLNERARKLFRRLVAKAVVRMVNTSLKGNLEDSRISEVPYDIGMDFDVERTIERIIEEMKRVEELKYDDIVGLDRRRKGYSVIVVLDSSGSMSGKKILGAAIMASLISHKVRKGRYSIIGFNSEAFPIKLASETDNSIEVVERILDLVPLGYTNISDGLVKALEESKGMRDPRFILITDGEHNVGEDPRNIVSRMNGVHVIYIGSKRSGKGIKSCKELAKLSNGRFHELNDLQKIPSLINRILS